MPLDTSTQITIGGVGVWDEDAPEEHFETNGANNYAIRKLRCAWGDRASLVNFLLGGSQVVAGTDLIVTGQSYPDFPNLVCQIAVPAGEGLRSQGPRMVAYERALVTATFKPPQFTFGDPAQIGSQELTFGQTVLALDQRQSSFAWADGTLLPPSGMPVLRISECKFIIRAYNRPTIPVQTILSLLDCSNSGTFYGAATEHIIFTGARSQRKFTSAGAENWDMEYSFRYRRQGSYNQLFKPGSGGGWTNFFFRDGSTKLFPPSNLSALFAA